VFLTDRRAWWLESRAGRTNPLPPTIDLRRSTPDWAICAKMLAGSRIYYLNRRGTTFVVAASPEFRLLEKNDLGDGSRFDASPAVYRNHILIRSNKFLYCVGR